MAFDSIKKKVSDYKNKKSEFEEMQKEFEQAYERIMALSELDAASDSDTAPNIAEVQRAYDREHLELFSREEELNQEREQIAGRIEDEHRKHEKVEDKLRSAAKKKYSGGIFAALQKNDDMMAELDALFAEIGETGHGAKSSPLDAAGMQGGGKEISAESASHSFAGVGKPASGTGKAVPGGGPKFGNFDLAKREGSSDYFVQGMHYQQFIRDYYNYNPSAYEDLNKNPVMATIAPGDIEGISLGKNEAEDSARFWGQHERGGTMESFVAIANNIPEVQMLIDGGFTLDQIRQDSRLSQCVDLYFDPAKMTRVIQCGNYYEFCDNGRHRVLAAREAGYKIPVKIVGRRKW